MVKTVFLVLLFFCRNCVVCGQSVFFNVTEEQGISDFVGNIADSANLGQQDDIRFTLLVNGYPHSSKFKLDELTGDLFTAESVDRDAICPFVDACSIQLAAIAKSDLSDELYSIKVYIDIKDINDNSPIFDTNLISFSLIEGTPIGTSFPFNGASDKDSSSFSVQKYEILDDVPFRAVKDIFTDGRSMLKLIVIEPIDRESVASFQFQVQAYDGGDEPNVGTVMFSVSVSDVNDNAPTFTQQTYNKTINDDSPIDTVITQVFASDLDQGENGFVKYRLSSLQNTEILSTFKINETSGDIHLKQSLISRSKEYYRIIVEASDSAKEPLIAQALVFVRVLDHHNNNPEINVNLLSNKPYAEISEHASQGATVAHVAVSDPDTGDNGLVTCKLTENTFRLQKFDTNEYKVVVFQVLDRETQSQYEVVISCQDTGSPPKSTNKSFNVVISDENDQVPRFSQDVYTTTVVENNSKGLTILQVSAVDDDMGQNAAIEYQLQNNDHMFAINKLSGEIVALQALDREFQTKHSFLVLAVDKGSPSLTGTGSVVIDVNDVNDNAPSFPKTQYTIQVLENSSPNKIIGEIQASDPDEGRNQNISYNVRTESGNDGVFIIVQNGSILVTLELNREMKEHYNFQVIAIDQGIPSLSSSTEVLVIVEDENDNKPTFLFPSKHNNTISISFKTAVNSAIGIFRAYDNDAGMNAQLSFFVESDNVTDYFLLNSYSGEIYLIKELSEMDIGMWTFEVIVQDRGKIPLKSVANVTIEITHDVPALLSGMEKNMVTAIALTTVTVLLALLIILTIYLLRRQESINRARLQESHDSNSQKTTDGEEAGFVPIPSPVFYPSTYTLPIPVTYTRPPPPAYGDALAPKPSHQFYVQGPKFNTIQRSISVQVSFTSNNSLCKKCVRKPLLK